MVKNNLNKNEMEHVRRRVDEVVKCTNGEIATVLNRVKKGTGLTDQRKYRMIKNGEATLITEKELVDDRNLHRYDSLYDVIVKCFNYPETTTQADKREFNNRVENKKEELMQEVVLEGKRLIDRIVLGIIPLKDVPDELHMLGSMTAMARQFKTTDFNSPAS